MKQYVRNGIGVEHHDEHVKKNKQEFQEKGR